MEQTTRPLMFAELFAGVGGLSMGLERAGWACAFHAEINADARAVLSTRWPHVPLYGDVIALSGGRKMKRWLQARHPRGSIDLVTGGSPCQDLSVAGKRAGLAGARSSLFFRQMRLWKILGADLCLWENVDGARSSNRGADFALVLQSFVGAAVAVPSAGWRSAGVAVGPTGIAAWRVLDAQFFGVPQRRRRVFVLGSRTGRIDPAEVLSLAESVCGDSASSREAWEDVAADAVSSVASESGPGWWDAGRSVAPLRASPGGTVSHIAFDWANSASLGMECRSESSDSLRVRSVPAVFAFDTTQITHPENRCNPHPGDPCHPLSASGHAPTIAYAFGSHASSDGEATNSSHDAGGPVGFGLNEELSPALRAGRTQAVCATGDITHSLTHEGHDASEDGTGRGTPVVVGTLTSSDGGADIDRAIGNQIVATLDSRESRGGFPGSDGAMTGHVQAPQGIPRRLTPRECERLMSWADDHTLVERNGKPLSDSARYRLCGNGVASVVTHWIGWRLRLAIEAAS